MFFVSFLFRKVFFLFLWFFSLFFLFSPKVLQTRYFKRGALYYHPQFLLVKFLSGVKTVDNHNLTIPLNSSNNTQTTLYISGNSENMYKLCALMSISSQTHLYRHQVWAKQKWRMKKYSCCCYCCCCWRRKKIRVFLSLKYRITFIYIKYKHRWY